MFFRVCGKKNGPHETQKCVSFSLESSIWTRRQSFPRSFATGWRWGRPCSLRIYTARVSLCVKSIRIYRPGLDFTPDFIPSCLLWRLYSVHFTRHSNAITGCNELRGLAGASARESNRVIAAFVNVIYQRESRAGEDERRVGSRAVKTLSGRLRGGGGARGVYEPVVRNS